MPDLTLLVIALLGGTAIAVSKLVRRFVPEIIVFLALGVLIGPDGPFELINDTNIEALELLTELALAAIIFLIGDRLRIEDLRARRGLLVPLNVVQLLATGTLVFAALRMVGVDTRVAVLLALIAAETGVLTVTATVKEQRAAGDYTDTVLASVALTNVAVAAMFGLTLPFVLALSGVATTPGAIFGVFAQIVVASTLIGLLGGLLLKTYGPAIESSGELLLFLLIVLTGMTGATLAVEGSVVLTSLVAGLYVANAAPWLADRFFAAVRTLEAPIYLIFFVVAGADIHLEELVGAGLAGTAYVVARTIGKVGGAAGGAVLAGGASQLGLGARTGLSLLPHAGMAIALVAFVTDFAPDLGLAVSPIVLGSIVVFELTGPLLTRRMLLREGEVGAAGASDEPVLDEMKVTRSLRRVLIPAGNAEVLIPRLPFLFDLVGSLGAEAVVVHVSLPTGPYDSDDEHEPALLRVFREIAAERGIACTTVHRRAESVASVIVAVAEDHECDLIVMGEPVRTRLLEPPRWGLISQRVVRDTTVPVLVYPVDPSHPENVPEAYLRRASGVLDASNGAGTRKRSSGHGAHVAGNVRAANAAEENVPAEVGERGTESSDGSATPA